LALRIPRPNALPAPALEEGTMRFIFAFLATAALAIVPAVSSAQSGPYVGGGVGYFSVDTGGFDGSDTAFKLFGGYRMNQYFATELEYIDGGNPDDSGFEVNLVPHTVANTAFARTPAGAAVNLEVDLIARYVERLTQTS